jgi:hypothetical protein
VCCGEPFLIGSRCVRGWRCQCQLVCFCVVYTLYWHGCDNFATDNERMIQYSCVAILERTNGPTSVPKFKRVLFPTSKDEHRKDTSGDSQAGQRGKQTNKQVVGGRQARCLMNESCWWLFVCFSVLLGLAGGWVGCVTVGFCTGGGRWWLEREMHRERERELKKTRSCIWQ